MSRSRGFTAVEAVVAVVIVAAVALAGWFVLNRMDDNKKSTTETSTPAAPTVNGTRDLDSANKALDETNLDASTQDSIDLDDQLHDF